MASRILALETLIIASGSILAAAVILTSVLDRQRSGESRAEEMTDEAAEAAASLLASAERICKAVHVFLSPDIQDVGGGH